MTVTGEKSVDKWCFWYVGTVDRKDETCPYYNILDLSNLIFCHFRQFQSKC